MLGRKNRAACLVGVVMTALALTAGGCASSSSGGEKVAENYTRTRGHLSAAQAQIDETMGSLKSMRMTDATNLSNAFNQYKQAVAGLQKKSDEARKLASDMQEHMDTNMMNWQKEIASIEDPTVKASVASRQEAVRSNYAQLKTYAQEARSAYDPFLKDNQDIIKALSINLSPAAVSSLATSMDQTAADARTVKEKIANMQRAMDNMARGQAPSGMPAK